MDKINHLETIHRNTYLVDVHKRLPSYCFWREEDIKEESLDQRIKWWIEAYKKSTDKKTPLLWVKQLKILKKNLSQINSTFSKE